MSVLITCLGNKEMDEVGNSRHWTTENGNPDGGVTYGPGYCIAWQRGPMRSVLGEPIPRNGAFITDVLRSVVDRLNHHQTSKFKNRANGVAIGCLLEAIEALEGRITERKERGVDGTHIP